MVRILSINKNKCLLGRPKDVKNLFNLKKDDDLGPDD